MKRFLLSLVCSVMVTSAAAASPLKLGLSLGPRWLLEGGSVAAVSPIDSTLHLDPIARSAQIISATAALFPWYEDEAPPRALALRRLGFLVHAEVFALGGQSAAIGFNQSIEGGLGLVYRCHKQVGFALAWEAVRARLPRAYIAALDGRRVNLPPGALAVEDDAAYREAFLQAFSLKVVWFPSQ